MKKSVLIGISSGIAAYKTLDLIRLLKKDNIDVRITMTRSASKMVSSSELKKLSGHKIYTTIFEKGFNYKNVLKSRIVEHIKVADSVDVMVIVPATANIIAKLAHGIADDFLTTTVLAVTVPQIICPSMNVNMWHNPIVQQNIEKLKSLGYQVIPPDSGMLACGYEGEGRLPDVVQIRDEILRQINRTESLLGKKIIITAGGTRENIDDVRYITNRSSGKMGVAIAEECYLRGAEVLLLRSVNSVRPRYLIREELFSSAEDLWKLMKKYIKTHDVIFHTAAVSDFQLTHQVKGKISSRRSLTLKLKPALKIIDQIKKINPKIALVAFKAEYGLKEKPLIATAYKRLQESNADAIIVNDVSRQDRGFEADTNEVYMILPDRSVQKISLSSKRSIAETIVTNLFVYPQGVQP